MTTVIEFNIPDKIRKDSLNMLKEYFDESTSKIIEKGFYDFTKQYCESNNSNIVMARAIYKDAMKNFIYNCKQDHQTIRNLKKKIIQKEFNPYDFAFLRPEELDEDLWMKIILRKNTSEEKLNNLPTINWRACKNCKSIEYSYFQLQTRSSDEPMTTFYICKKCNKVYRVNN